MKSEEPSGPHIRVCPVKETSALLVGINDHEGRRGQPQAIGDPDGQKGSAGMTTSYSLEGRRASEGRRRVPG